MEIDENTILEELNMYNKMLERHRKNPDDYEETYIDLLKHSINILEWVLEQKIIAAPEMRKNGTK